MRKLPIILLLFVSLGLIPVGILANNQNIPKPWVNGRSVILIEVSTGKILYSKNPNQIMAPASTTKIMTGILGIEKGDLTKTVRVSASAASKSGSSMNLRKNEQLTLKDLLYGLLLSSGNDAATAIAEAIAGSESRFAQIMTKKARQLGLKHTQFQNASGLPAVNHYTTAYDLARIARYAIQNPVFAAIVQTKETVVPGPTPGETAKLVNHNKLLWEYPYSTGIKTGYTRKAGKCLVASAKKQNVTLIAVVLKSGTMYTDSRKLFEYGFQFLKVPDPTPVSKPANPTSLAPNTANSSVPGAADWETTPPPESIPD
jgi:D-alanyl-D-alanine carboxypeptidase (penicillin-binding protein 5/6)